MNAQYLIENGFTVNVHGDAYDNGQYRVFFDDIDIHVIKFNDPKIQIVEWENTISGNIGAEKIMTIIDAMMQA